MRKALRAWLWLLFVWNFCNLVGDLATIFNYGFTMASATVFLLHILSLASVLILLFTNKKVGFYVMCFATVFGMVYNFYVLFQIIGKLMKFQIIMSVSPIILSLAVPAITYLLLAKNWKDME